MEFTEGLAQTGPGKERTRVEANPRRARHVPESIKLNVHAPRKIIPTFILPKSRGRGQRAVYALRAQVGRRASVAYPGIDPGTTTIHIAQHYGAGH